MGDSALSTNDRRVLDAIHNTSPEYDGWAPHGQRDWLAVRRLLAAGLIRSVGVAICYECDSAIHRRDPTEVQVFVAEADHG